VFEMPLAGFLGFPPFAVESVVFLRWLGAWRDRLPPARVRAARMAALVLGPLAVLAMFAAVDPVVVDSVYVPFARLDVVPAVVRARLRAAGIESPEQLLRVTASPSDRAEWAERTALPLEELEAARARVALVVHRGLGLGRVHDLDALGIRTLDDLAPWSAEDLAAAMAERRPHDRRNRFLARRARVWTSGLGDATTGDAR